jgi:glycosyltransferase involved in cell wall biosynthesis
MPDPTLPAAARPRVRLTGRDIVCVGFADWETELPTNQHHLMSRLAASGNRVLFVESLGLRQPQLGGRDLRRLARRLRRGLSGPRPGHGGVQVLAPLVLPLHRFATARALNARLLPALVRRAAGRLGLRRPILWAYVPQADVLIDALDPSLVVYHCVDDIAAQPGVDAASFRAAEERFARRADLVLASAPALAQRLRGLGAQVLDAPNVADTALFATALEPGAVDPELAAIPGPRIVFTGAIVGSKLDFELIAGLAKLRPGWSFVLVGPIGPGDPSTDVSPLQAQPNVHLLGRRPHDRLPELLRGADAGFIPYAINGLTRSVFPMKVYEMLAAGLPVVATPLPALAGIDAVATAPAAGPLAALLDAALAGDTPVARAQRSRAAAGHSWDARLEQIAAAVAEIEDRGRR